MNSNKHGFSKDWENGRERLFFLLNYKANEGIVIKKMGHMSKEKN